MMIDKTIKVIKDINKTIDVEFEMMLQNQAEYNSKWSERNGIVYSECEKVIKGIKEFEQLYYEQQKYKSENMHLN